MTRQFKPEPGHSKTCQAPCRLVFGVHEGRIVCTPELAEEGLSSLLLPTWGQVSAVWAAVPPDLLWTVEAWDSKIAQLLSLRTQEPLPAQGPPGRAAPDARMRVKGSDPDGHAQRAHPGAAPIMLAPYRLVGQQPAARGPASAQPGGGLKAAAKLHRVASSASMQSEDGDRQQAAAGRGQRKRKPSHVSFADDMVPTDVLLRRSSKSKQQELRQQLGAQVAPLAPAASDLPAGTQAPLAPAAGPPVLKAEPGTFTAPLALGGMASPAVIDLTAVVPAVMPYVLVHPGAPSSAVQVVQVASAWDIVQLRKQMEEEERRRVNEVLWAQQQAAADARVVLRVLPGDQAAGRSGSKGSKQLEGLDSKDAKRQGQQRQPGPAGRRAGRASRRATPELEDPAEPLAPHMWHPGLSVFDGIGYVDPVRSSAALPPPVLLVGTPSRWEQPSTYKPTPPEFSEDPVRASLEYLKYLATTTGRLPSYGGQLQQAVNAEHRLYQDRVRRAHYARCARVSAAMPPRPPPATPFLNVLCSMALRC